MKLFAYYLPQYHCIPENDQWWGKGFTEWTNVKKSKPLFKGHKQPQTPLNNNYYDLSKVETLKWQEQLMKNYGVDGLVIYHYYFTGKKLLEKPAELLLKNKDINIDFFFCWANHTWCRSWQGKKDILVEQTYGNVDDWKEHFDYLLPFFKDKRYQKIDNKPVLMLFNSSFDEKEKIIDYFNKKCIENGFKGICIIESTHKYNIKQIQNNTDITRFYHFREPTSAWYSYTRNLLHVPVRAYNLLKKILSNKGCKTLIKYNGNKFYKIMIKQAKKHSKNNEIRGLYFEWDNTPRHGYRGYIITPPKKELFMKYMDLIKEDEYVFINAWNEWCEGMMLEPTEIDKYKYLDWIKEWKDNENRTNGM